jgi:glyoxylate/hydroxypyruvate reductase
VQTYIGAADLDEFKRRADIIVLLLPLTSATEHLIDSQFLAGIRDGAALINVGRGALIVENALIAALDAGRLRRAVLDVFRTEPLPAEHVFWSHPKITITPHNSSATNPATALGQIVENIRRAMAGEKLLHPGRPPDWLLRLAPRTSARRAAAPAYHRLFWRLGPRGPASLQ